DILAANVASADALGTSVTALHGASLTSYASDPIGLAEGLRRRADLQFSLRARDGRRFLCDTSLLAPNLLLSRPSGGPEAEPRARRFFDTLSRLYGITAVDGPALDDVPAALLTEAANSVGAVAGAIFLVDEGGGNLELKVSVRYPEHYA